MSRSAAILKLSVYPFVLFVLSCSNAPQISTYASYTPKLEVETFFDGKLMAKGILKNRSGKVTRWFTADINAYWRDGVGTLDEEFLFNDGERQTRVWTLKPTKDSEHAYLATAGDVVGEAKVQVSGNAMFLKYVLQIPYKNSTLDVKIDDRMYLVDADTLINESTLYNWGFRVGTLTLSIEKVD